jgi:gamma-glutamylcyclotransferase
MKYYFAYGSNMNEEVIRERCSDPECLGKAYLPDYKLGFTRYSKNRESGVADILISPGEVVWGLIYQVTDHDVASLDRYEGHPNAYRRINEKAMLFNYPPNFLENLIEQIGEDTSLSYKYDLFSDLNNFQELDVITYEVVEKASETIHPSREYIRLLLDAAYENNFPGEYQELIYQFGQGSRDKLNSLILDLFSDLYELIKNKAFPSDIIKEPEWGGAELVITGEVERKNMLNKNYPDDLVVLTPYWRELSWVIKTIFHHKGISWNIDHMNKYYFLRQLGESALKYQEENPNDNSPVGICDATLTRAYVLFTGTE